MEVENGWTCGYIQKVTILLEGSTFLPFFFTSMVMGRGVFLLKSWTHDFGYSQKWPLATTRWAVLVDRYKWTYGALIKWPSNKWVFLGLFHPTSWGPISLHLLLFFLGGPPCKVVAELVDVFFCLPCCRCSYVSLFSHLILLVSCLMSFCRTYLSLTDSSQT